MLTSISEPTRLIVPDKKRVDSRSHLKQIPAYRRAKYTETKNLLLKFTQTESCPPELLGFLESANTQRSSETGIFNSVWLCISLTCG
jgi:hypothetical protein